MRSDKDYIEINKKSLEYIRKINKNACDWLELYLYCQNIYAEAIHKGLSDNEAWHLASKRWNETSNNILKCIEIEWELDSLSMHENLERLEKIGTVYWSGITFIQDEYKPQITNDDKFIIIVKKFSFKGFIFPEKFILKDIIIFGSLDFTDTTFHNGVIFRKSLVMYS